MTKQSDQDFSENRKKIEKTFVEGDVHNSLFGSLQPGKKLDATSLGSTNPYAQQTNTGLDNTSIRNGTNILPNGKDPIPLGSGTVVGLLGCGGMAKVYKIWNEKLEVFRAVKILLPNQQSDLKSRFETEVKITAKLHHPNIVEIYNVGEWNGLPYLEMEFIDGESLEAFISKHGKLPDTICNSIAIFIARALAYSHSQEFLIYGKTYHGVIHRDLKPANIMISKNGDVRLMDFGIARPTETSLHTVEGNIVGTMQYLSPEQMDGVDIDCRTDIYSFGAILYEMLTGTKTFPQDTITNLMKKKIMNDYRRFTDFDFHISPILSKTSQKCLHLNREDRYPNMETLLRELESIHRSISNEPPAKVIKQFQANPESFGKFRKKNIIAKFSGKILVPASAVAIIAALITFFLLTGPDTQLGNEKTVASVTPEQPSMEQSTDTRSPVTESPQTTDSLKPLSSSENKPVSNNAESVKKPEAKPAGTVAPKPKPQKAPSVPRKPSQETIKQEPPKPELSAVEKLKLKYESSDLLETGKKAAIAGAYSDVITALEKVDENGPEGQLRTLLLFEAYLKTYRNKDALYIANSKNYNDAQYDFLCAKMYENMGKTGQALELFQSALTKPSVVRSRNEIRNDALYYTATIWSKNHVQKPSPESRIQALNAWNIVKRAYSNKPDHPRFKKANSELASIQ